MASAMLVAVAVAQPVYADPGGRSGANQGGAHFFYTKKAQHEKTAKGAQPFDTTTDMAYHGGPVMRDVTTYVVFWNPTTLPPTIRPVRPCSGRTTGPRSTGTSRTSGRLHTSIS